MSAVRKVSEYKSEDKHDVTKVLSDLVENHLRQHIDQQDLLTRY